MKSPRFFLGAFACLFTCAVAAQDTNILKTQIGQFENRTGLLVKGFGRIGAVQAGAVEISVGCKENSDGDVTHKIYGLSVAFSGTGAAAERIYVDEDEIDALLSGLNYLLKITYDVTALPSFEASYTTKGGLQILAHSLRKEGSVEFSMQGNYSPPVPLSSVQMTQLYNLIQQAEKTLNAIKTGK
jgi:hypothetical protein